MKKIVFILAVAAFGVNLAFGQGDADKLDKQCREENLKSCDLLGHFYYFGLFGRGQDYAKAKYYFEKVCTKSNVQKDKTLSTSCSNIAKMYVSGAGVPRNYEKAVEYFSIACDAGKGADCTNLGMFYQQGIGAQKSIAKAAKYYKRGCEGGDYLGCFGAGNANVAMQNYAEAKKYYRKVCEQKKPGRQKRFGALLALNTKS